MKVKLSHVISISAVLAVSACTTTSEPSPEMQKITNQQSEIEDLKTQQVALEAQLQTWQEMEPDIERIVALESELNELILLQKEQAKADKLKMIEEKRKMREARPFFMVQVASLTSLDNLKKNWETQQEQYPEILNGLPARYQNVEMNGKEYYRLKAGEFNHKAQAVEVCEMLISKKAECIVVNNKGTKLL